MLSCKETYLLSPVGCQGSNHNCSKPGIIMSLMSMTNALMVGPTGHGLCRLFVARRFGPYLQLLCQVPVMHFWQLPNDNDSEVLRETHVAGSRHPGVCRARKTRFQLSHRNEEHLTFLQKGFPESPLHFSTRRPRERAPPALESLKWSSRSWGPHRPPNVFRSSATRLGRIIGRETHLILKSEVTMICIIPERCTLKGLTG